MPGYANSAHLLDPDHRTVRRGCIGAFLYDGLIRDVLMARGEKPDPEAEERGRTVRDEPSGA